MLLRRVLCTTVVLFLLALLHGPQPAHSVVIDVDNTLGLTGESPASYNNQTSVLTITGNNPFNLTLAASKPVLSLKLTYDARGRPST